jgi:hypothetical protein
MATILKYLISGLFLSQLIILYSCINPVTKDEMNENNFTTWQNPCFDRCASIWLIKNFVDSTATFRFIEFGKKVTEGIPFDVPGAELGRQKNISCFESIIQKYDLNNPSITQMAKVIHDIDVNKWGVKVTKDADSLEIVFNEFRKHINTDKELVDKTSELFRNMYKKYGP